jgi:ssDNA-binding Zn-finger/Zn-ribbon topoisomerase 1
MSIEDKILTLLKKHPKGLKAREIADGIPGTDRKVINQALYGLLKDKCEHDDSYRWHIRAKNGIESTPSAPTVLGELKAVPKSDAIQGAVRCPKCGATMVKRIAQSGFNRGGEFWGCSRYPECKGTRSVKSVDPPKSPIIKKSTGADKPTPKSSRSKSVKFCEECIIYLNNECDGKGNANCCPAYKFGG